MTDLFKPGNNTYFTKTAYFGKMQWGLFALLSVCSVLWGGNLSPTLVWWYCWDEEWGIPEERNPHLTSPPTPGVTTVFTLVVGLMVYSQSNRVREGGSILRIYHDLHLWSALCLVCSLSLSVCPLLPLLHTHFHVDMWAIPSQVNWNWYQRVPHLSSILCCWVFQV